MLLSCGYPGAPAHSSLTFSAPELKPGVVASYACERGFELLGPARRICQADGRWLPEGIPFCAK
ncbi:CUB and sushi domain-containing protein 2 [Orchesella cincta]|uniref:CUB and sushi domain-containing protein 2 n=1 Tax=Orchesella cincta TaxID=48709 RepID=A0A1D2N5Z5_ORCCI|nr:CUB and sushi domain-containing protein 2 [Orchesella cincta]